MTSMPMKDRDWKPEYLLADRRKQRKYVPKWRTVTRSGYVLTSGQRCGQ